MGLRKFSELKKLLNEVTILLKVALNAIKQTNFNLNITEVSSSIDKSKINYLLDHLCNIFSNSAKITLINCLGFFLNSQKQETKLFGPLLILRNLSTKIGEMVVASYS